MTCVSESTGTEVKSFFFSQENKENYRHENKHRVLGTQLYGE